MAESIQHFALKTIGLSRCNGRKPCTLLEAARHNLREIQAELGASGHIDARRMVDNVVMAGPSTASEVEAHAHKLLAVVDTSKLKRDHVQAIEAVFSLPAETGIDTMTYFVRCLEWVREALPMPVLLATAHRDEEAPHLHVLLLPIAEGRHVGGGLIDRPKLRDMRESFFQKVAGPAGLKRDGAKVRGLVKQWAVAAVLARCQALGLPEANGPLWAVLVAAIERDPTASMLALQIDVNAIRPSADKPPSPIALAPSPIALGSATEIEVVSGVAKIKGQSCVALLHKPPQNVTQKVAPAIDSLDALWAAVGCRSVWTKPTDAERARLHQLAIDRTTKASQTTAERMKAARDAEARAKARHVRNAPPVACVRAGAVHRHNQDDSLTRVRDEFAHDTAAWND